MASHVFANGREVLCKVSGGKILAAFPDVCLSPPPPPTGPVPIPYPNFAKAVDLANGSKTVMIKGKPVHLRKSSYLKTITGDEAATRNFGGSVVTHVITGTAWFQSWSPDVFVEGEEVVRHLDMCTTNHASTPGSTPPMTALAEIAPPWSNGECTASALKTEVKCENDKDRECPDDGKLRDAKKKAKAQEAYCADKKMSKVDKKAHMEQYRDEVSTAYQEYAKKVAQNQCQTAKKCDLGPYKPKKCCEPQTPHHLVDVCSFLEPGERKKARKDYKPKARPGCEEYNMNKALCVCAEGHDNSTGTHGLMHLQQRQWAADWKKANPGKPWTLDVAISCGVESMSKVFPLAGCNAGCIAEKLRDHHGGMGIKPDQEINCRPSGAREQEFGERWTDLMKKEVEKLKNENSGQFKTIKRTKG